MLHIFLLLKQGHGYITILYARIYILGYFLAFLQSHCFPPSSASLELCFPQMTPTLQVKELFTLEPNPPSSLFKHLSLPLERSRDTHQS